ncbi:MAG: glycosyltransferase family 4 protein [Patescibacteria group bacterium]
MKILAIAADIDPQRIGGAEAHFVEVLKRIAPKLEKVTVLVGNNTSLKNLFIKDENVEIIKVLYPKIQNLNWLTYSIFCIPYALKYKFDLIWVKQEYLVNAGAVIKFITGKPLYVTCQNPNVAGEEWNLSRTITPIFTRFLMFGLRFADTVAAVSHYSANLAKKYRAKRVVIIPNGVTC